ncbi:MAG: cation diffusion facilitator CzcD-associated flavoprotein CzcO [Hyphomicrobiaceae bacterium]|jgi:cation diffusion facilitator CzcD-associated flavoprotein CzcO
MGQHTTTETQKAFQGSPRVAVIGAGMSGILMAIKLKEAGLENFTVYEKADTVGGTWRENTYPGIACDVPSHHYCYSFEPNPEWSRRFSPGSETKAYFERCAEKYGVLPHVRFNTTIERMTWEDGAWNIETQSAGHTEHTTADIVVSAAGVLHCPAFPNIEGLDTFAGDAFHTARWNHDIDLTGKRVGVIGTGSTAAQVVPAIVEKVAKLSLFQRTAQWVHPLPDKSYTALGKALFRTIPLTMKGLYGFYYRALEKGFSEVVIGERSAEGLNARCQKNLETVADSTLRAKLTPDYQPGCKRLIFSSAFYPAMQKPNAELVTDRIDRIEPQGIRTADGQLHELDVLVLSTGFKADRFLRPIEVKGQDGVDLNEIWERGPQAYRSVAVPGLPNFFMLIGPHSPIGNLSLIAIAEWQATYVMRCIDKIRRENVQIMPTPEATTLLAEQMKEASQKTVWVSGCKSWYLDADGQPALYPWKPSRFHEEMTQPPMFADFDVRPLKSNQVADAA